MKFLLFLISLWFSLQPALRTLDIFVTSSLQPNGTGSQASPYNSFLKAVREVSIFADSVQDTELNIFLVTSFLLIFETELSSLAFPQNNGKYQLFANFSKFQQVRVMPYACFADFLASAPAESCRYYTIFAMKSNNFTMNIDTSFRVQNLVFQGNDLNLQYNAKTDAVCWISAEGCCKDSYLLQNPYDSRCDLTTIYRVSRSSSFTKYPLFLVNSSTKSAELAIVQCQFNNFNEIQKNFGYSSLISAAGALAKLAVFSSIFSKNYLRDGLFETATSTDFSNVTVSYYNFYGFYESSAKKPLISATNCSLSLENCTILNVSAFMKASNCEISLKNTRISGKCDSIKLTNSPAAFLFELNTANFTIIDTILSDFAIDKESAATIRSFFGVSGKIVADFDNFSVFANDFENNLFFSASAATSLRFSMRNSKISNSSAKSGGVFLISGSASASGTLNFSNLSVTDLQFCEGSSLFSAIYQDFSIENASFTRFSLLQEGQCASKPIFAVYGNFSAKHSIFQEISFSTRIFTFSLENTVIFSNCSFLSILGVYNGVFSSFSTQKFLIETSYFLNIRAPQYAVFEVVLAKETSILLINSSLFRNISATISAATAYSLFLIRNAQFSVLGSLFSQISGNSTAIYAENSANFSIITSIFAEIQAVSQPGVFSLWNCTVFFRDAALENATSLQSFAGAGYFSNISGIFLNFSCKNVRVRSLWQPAGAFYAFSRNNLSFFSSFFLENYNLYDQGGLFFAKEYNFMSFSSCVFFNNSAFGGEGGAFSLDSSNFLRVESSQFLQFYAQTAGIYADFGNFLEIESTIFANFSALKEGAAIFADSFNNISIKSTNFSKGTSKLRGGALFFLQRNAISLKFAGFFENSCEISGGALALGSNNQILAENSAFSRNFAQVFGGALFSSSNNSVSLKNSEFRNNSAINEGGTLSFEEKNAVFLENCVFLFSFSTNAGTLRVLQYNSLLLLNISAISCESLANSAFFLLYFFNSFEIRNSSLENLHSGGSAAFGYLSYSNNAAFYQVSLQKCESQSSGGLIYSSETNSLRFYKVFVTNVSSAGQSGGLFYLRSLNFVSLEGIFAEKVSTFYSGALAWAFYFNEIAIVSSNFSSFETVQESAGIVYADHSNYISINASFFEKISAKSSGGAFYLYSLNILKIVDTKLKNLTNFKDFAGFLYLESQNNVTIAETAVEGLQSGSGKSVLLYAETDNFISFFAVFVSSRENPAAVFENYVFSASQNTISLKNLSFQLNFSTIFLELVNSALFLENANLTQKLRCGIFAVLKSCAVSLQNVKFLHFVDKSLFSLQNCSFSLQKFVISPKLVAESPLISLFQALNCTISLRKGTIKLQNPLQFLAASNLRSLNVSKISYFAGFSRNSLAVFELVDVFAVFIEKSLFFGAKLAGSGAIFAFSAKIVSCELRIKSSIFFENRAKHQGGVLFFATSAAFRSQLSIKTSNFLINRASSGGVAALFNVSQTFVAFSRFSLNRAQSLSPQSSKAGVFLCVSLENPANFTISFAQFSHNRAQIGGAVFQQGNVRVFAENATFLANSAEFYGPGLASEVAKITFVTDFAETLRAVTLRGIKTGVFFEAGSRFFLAGIDKYSNLAIKNSDLLEEMLDIVAVFSTNSTDSLQFSQLSPGVFPLTGPFRRTSFPLQTNSAYKLSFSGNSSISADLSLFLSFTACELGERLLENFTCVRCDPGQYSFSENFAEFSAPCTICADFMPFNCFGGSFLTPKRDYWRISAVSSNFMKCAKDACLGDPRDFSAKFANFTYFPQYATGICENGYTGVLCDECAQGYGKVNENSCVLCSSGSYGLNLITQLLLRVVFTLFSVNSAMTMSVSITKKLSKDAVSNAVASNILKVFINHVQILALVLSLPFHWPEKLGYSLSIAFSFSPSVSESLSLDCILQSFQVSTSALYYKVIAAVLYPFCVLFLCLLERMLRSFVRKRKKPAENAEKHEFPLCWYPFSLLLIVFLLCYCDVVQVILQMVEHQNFGDEKTADYRVVRDKSIKYFSESHQHLLRVYAVPLAVLLGIVCPLAIFAFLLHKRVKKRLNQRFVLFNFGFYYYTFKENYFFWDILTLLRKISVFFVKMYFFSSTQKSLYPLNIIQAIILLSLMLQINFKPYQAPEFDMINGFETNSLITLYISYYFATFYMFKKLSEENLENSQSFYLYAGICGLFPATANILFVLKFLRLYYKHSIQKKVIKTLEIASSGLKKFKTFVKSGTKKSLESPRSAKNCADSPVSAKRPSEFGLLKKIEISSFREVVGKFEESKEIRLDFEKKPQLSQEKHGFQANVKRNARFCKDLSEFYVKNLRKLGKWQEICEKNCENSEQNCEISGFFRKKAAKSQQNRKNAGKTEVVLEFLEENFEFFNCVLAKAGTFLKNEQFSIDFCINYVTLQGILFVKVFLSFQAKETITNFEFFTETEPLENSGNS